MESNFCARLKSKAYRMAPFCPSQPAPPILPVASLRAGALASFAWDSICENIFLGLFLNEIKQQGLSKLSIAPLLAALLACLLQALHARALLRDPLPVLYAALQANFVPGKRNPYQRVGRTQHNGRACSGHASSCRRKNRRHVWVGACQPQLFQDRRHAFAKPTLELNQL